MATGTSRVADLNSYFNNIYEDAVFVAREQNLMTRLVRVFRDGQGDQTRTLSEYSQVTASSVAETEDFSNPTRFSKGSVSTLSPGEIMAQVVLTDRRIETDPQNARQDASTELGYACATKFDTDILGNLSSLTCGTVGAAGSTMIWGYFFAALTRMRNSNVPPPYYCVLHPYQYHNLGKSASIAASTSIAQSPAFTDQVMRQWWVQNVAGVDIFVTSNITSGTAAYGAMFNPNALAFDLRRDIRLEPERDASKRAWELNISALYAQGVWRPAWGVQIIADASAPES